MVLPCPQTRRVRIATTPPRSTIPATRLTLTSAPSHSDPSRIISITSASIVPLPLSCDLPLMYLGPGFLCSECNSSLAAVLKSLCLAFACEPRLEYRSRPNLKLVTRLACQCFRIPPLPPLHINPPPSSMSSPWDDSHHSRLNLQSSVSNSNSLQLKYPLLSCIIPE